MADNLRQLQLVELDILKKILEIIERHQLRYYVLGGTLLGAVRHKGFIPWDDDIDIGIPRPDYDLFLQYAVQELSAPYQLHTLQTNTGEYSYYYARIENTDIKVRRKVALKEVVIPSWVDVFPLDGVPDEGFKRDVWLQKCRFYKALFRASQHSYFGRSAALKKKRSLPKEIIRRMFIRYKLEEKIDTQKAWEKLDRALRENDYNSCNALANICGYWGPKEMFPKAYYGEGKLYPFEDMMLNGPVNYDAVLTQMYGDYMTPPPADQQEHHYVELIAD